MPDRPPGGASEQAATADKNRRAAIRGAWFVLYIGAIAIVGIGLKFEGVVGKALFALMAVTTIGGTWLMYRFVLRHGSEIGEARFDTRNKSDVGDGDRP